MNWWWLNHPICHHRQNAKIHHPDRNQIRLMNAVNISRNWVRMTRTRFGTTGRRLDGNGAPEKSFVGNQPRGIGFGAKNKTPMAQSTKTNHSTSTTPSIGRQNEIAIRREKNIAHLAKLETNLTELIQDRNPKQLFESGLPITAALSVDRIKTKLILLQELTRAWRAVRLPDSKSWQNQSDLQGPEHLNMELMLL